MRRGWKVSGEIRFLWGRIKYICENWKGIQLFYLGRDTLRVWFLENFPQNLQDSSNSKIFNLISNQTIFYLPRYSFFRLFIDQFSLNQIKWDFICLPFLSSDNSVNHVSRPNDLNADRKRLAKPCRIADAIETIPYTGRIRGISLFIHGAPSREIGIQFERNHAGW